MLFVLFLLCSNEASNFTNAVHLFAEHVGETIEEATSMDGCIHDDCQKFWEKNARLQHSMGLPGLLYIHCSGVRGNKGIDGWRKLHNYVYRA